MLRVRPRVPTPPDREACLIHCGPLRGTTEEAISGSGAAIASSKAMRTARALSTRTRGVVSSPAALIEI
jgi:hypothetical protein